MNKLFLDNFVKAAENAGIIREFFTKKTSTDVGRVFEKRNISARILAFLPMCKFADQEMNKQVEKYIAEYSAWVKEGDALIDAHAESISRDRNSG